jgi:hypothetical protein
MKITGNTRNLLLLLMLVVLMTVIGCFSVETFANVARSYIFVPSADNTYVSYVNTLESFADTVDIVQKAEDKKKAEDKSGEVLQEKPTEGFTLLEMSPMVPIDVLQESSPAVPSTITNVEISQGMTLPITEEVIVARGGNGVAGAGTGASRGLLGADEYDTHPRPFKESLYLPLVDRYPPVDNGMGTIGCVGSNECYKADFQNKLQLTGNYRQMTNNYKHKYPDSCSGIPQEFIASFYV